MEISKVSFNGNTIDVLFNGKCYLFYNSYYGFIASAVRSDLRQDRGHEFFTVTAGNHHCLGGSLTCSGILSGVKRTIRRAECSHGATIVDFEVHEADLAGAFLDLVAGFRVR